MHLSAQTYWRDPQTRQEQTGGFFLTQAEAGWRFDEILQQYGHAPVNFKGDAGAKELAVTQELNSIKEEVASVSSSGCVATTAAAVSAATTTKSTGQQEHAYAYPQQYTYQYYQQQQRQQQQQKQATAAALAVQHQQGQQYYHHQAAVQGPKPENPTKVAKHHHGQSVHQQQQSKPLAVRSLVTHPETVRFVLPDVFPKHKEEARAKKVAARRQRLQEILALENEKAKEGHEGEEAAKENALDVVEEEKEKDGELLQFSHAPAIKPVYGWTGGFVPKDLQARLGGEWEDPRKCSLCKLTSDDTFLGRLLPLPDKDKGYWVHTNCAAWSSEAFEVEGGLFHVYNARSRSKTLKCVACGVTGATIGCNSAGCKENFHFLCAVGSGCHFFQDRRVFCGQHGSEGRVTKAGEPSKVCSKRVDNVGRIYTRIQGLYLIFIHFKFTLS